MRVTASLAAAVIRHSTPRGWRVRWVDETRPGMVHGGRREITIPRHAEPEMQLAYHLHECGHVHLRHLQDSLPAHVEEYEAERWALAAFRAYGIPVPAKVTALARRNVRDRVRKDRARGIDIDPRVAAWARRKP